MTGSTRYTKLQLDIEAASLAARFKQNTGKHLLGQSWSIVLFPEQSGAVRATLQVEGFPEDEPNHRVFLNLSL